MRKYFKVTMILSSEAYDEPTPDNIISCLGQNISSTPLLIDDIQVVEVKCEKQTNCNGCLVDNRECRKAPCGA